MSTKKTSVLISSVYANTTTTAVAATTTTNTTLKINVLCMYICVCIYNVIYVYIYIHITISSSSSSSSSSWPPRVPHGSQGPNGFFRDLDVFIFENSQKKCSHWNLFYQAHCKYSQASFKEAKVITSTNLASDQSP